MVIKDPRKSSLSSTNFAGRARAGRSSDALRLTVPKNRRVRRWAQSLSASITPTFRAFRAFTPSAGKALSVIRASTSSQVQI